MKLKIMYSLVIVVLGGMVGTIFTKQELYFHPEFKSKNRSNSFGITTAYAYPPGVGILTTSKNCLSCHANNGPWNDDANTIIDIIDKDTKKSLKHADGTFLIEVKKGEQKTVFTIIGSRKGTSIPASYRNAWLYIDPTTIGTSSLSKFAPNWDVNLPISCRLVGDNFNGYDNAHITSLPMTIQPLENAKDAELQLQIMLTKGESIKGNAQEGMIGNYFERKVKLKIIQ